MRDTIRILSSKKILLPVSGVFASSSQLVKLTALISNNFFCRQSIFHQGVIAMHEFEELVLWLEKEINEPIARKVMVSRRVRRPQVN